MGFPKGTCTQWKTTNNPRVHTPPTGIKISNPVEGQFSELFRTLTSYTQRACNLLQCENLRKSFPCALSVSQMVWTITKKGRKERQDQLILGVLQSHSILLVFEKKIKHLCYDSPHHRELEKLEEDNIRRKRKDAMRRNDERREGENVSSSQAAPSKDCLLRSWFHGQRLQCPEHLSTFAVLISLLLPKPIMTRNRVNVSV